jgi:hypothetical protein
VVNRTYARRAPHGRRPRQHDRVAHEHVAVRRPERVSAYYEIQAVTAGSPTPMTFSRRDSAVKANSFISWLE